MGVLSEFGLCILDKKHDLATLRIRTHEEIRSNLIEWKF